MHCKVCLNQSEEYNTKSYCSSEEQNTITKHNSNNVHKTTGVLQSRFDEFYTRGQELLETRNWLDRTDLFNYHQE